jgi:hypothetical protein
MILGPRNFASFLLCLFSAKFLLADEDKTIYQSPDFPFFMSRGRFYESFLAEIWLKKLKKWKLQVCKF